MRVMRRKEGEGAVRSVRVQRGGNEVGLRSTSQLFVEETTQREHQHKNAHLLRSLVPSSSLPKRRGLTKRQKKKVGVGARGEVGRTDVCAPPKLSL